MSGYQVRASPPAPGTNWHFGANAHGAKGVPIA
jgi:hypothetical protein